MQIPSSPPPGNLSLAAAVFRLKEPLERLASHLELLSLEWAVLFSVTGKHTVAEISQLLRLEPARAERVFAKLAGLGIIEERPLAYGDYLRALATVPDETPRNFATFLRQGATWGGSASPSREAAQTPADEPGDTKAPEHDLTQRRQPRVADSLGGRPEITFQPLALPTIPGLSAPVTPPRRGRLSLKALIQSVLDRAQDRASGQLDVYRVLIRVPTKLLKRNGINTLRFTDDHLIDDPELQRALEDSLVTTLGIPCPASLYVPS